jgi:hypothetical protein
MNQMRLFMDYLPDAKPISENILIPTTEAGAKRAFGSAIS